MHLQAGEGQHCPPRIAKSPLLSKIFRMNRNFIIYHCLSAYGVFQVCRNPNTQHFWHALPEFRLNQTPKTHSWKKDRGVFKVRTSWITGVPKPLKKLSEPICQPDCRQSGWWRVFLCTSSINYKVCTIINYHYNIVYPLYLDMSSTKYACIRMIGYSAILSCFPHQPSSSTRAPHPEKSVQHADLPTAWEANQWVLIWCIFIDVNKLHCFP